jgi:tRNA-dihydrouridine synthase C
MTNKCPKLFLAPMEGLGALPFRKAMVSIGGFDEACTEFIRVPENAHVESLARVYDASALDPYPQAAQIMGSDPNLMAEMTKVLSSKKAPRIELNCGCPSNTVTGRGAGSSLLKTPDLLYKITLAMVQSTTTAVSVKLRTGYQDTSLFEDNLFAAQEAGACFITLHARTKADGYKNPANWDYIAKAKDILKIPVVGNGDILNIDDALRMLQSTGCDALMIGRGAVINPWIFWEIKNYFSGNPTIKTLSDLKNFLEIFIAHIKQDSSEKNKTNHFKQLIHYLFRHTPSLENHKTRVLGQTYASLEGMLAYVFEILENNFVPT